jgi:hypothetical protein
VSEQTKAALEEAIRAHVADEAEGEPRVVTEWYVVTAAVGVEAHETHYLHVVSEASWHALLGLVHRAWKRMSSWEDIDQ